MRKTVVASLGALMMFTGADALAAPQVAVTSAAADGSSATVSGTVAFPAPGRQSVTTDLTSLAGAVGKTAVADTAGLNLTNALIEPLADGTGLRFTWQLASLPAQVPPEGVRYTWGFQIGERVYQLQAKRTNLVSLTTVEDPVNHIKQAAAQKSFFQLRGACQVSYQGAPVSGCFHLAFLEGGFDIAGSQVWIDLPYETRDAIGRLVAPDFKPGATLVDNAGNGTAGMTVAAAFQAVISNTDLARYFNDVAPYYVGARVELAVTKASIDADEIVYSTTATLNPDGTFSATVPGLTATTRTVRVRACNATECVKTKLAVA